MSSSLTRRAVLGGLYASLAPCRLLAQDVGRFSGQLVLIGTNKAGRFALGEDYTYVDRFGVSWLAPRGHFVDGASIPRAFWTIIGAPFTDAYTDAAVIHDVYCDLRPRAWRRTHEVFYEAMLARGVPPVKAKLIYTAVVVGGPRWIVEATYSCPLPQSACSHPQPTTLHDYAVTPIPDEQAIASFAGIRRQIEQNPALGIEDVAVLADAYWFARTTYLQTGRVDALGAQLRVKKEDDITSTIEYLLRGGQTGSAGQQHQIIQSMRRRQ